MLLSLLILLPLIAGLILTVIKHNRPLGFVGTAVSIYCFVYTLFLLFSNTAVDLTVIFPWFKLADVQANIALSLTGLGAAMVLLTTLVYTVLFLYFYTIKKNYSNSFYGLLLIAFAGLNGVFLAQDLLLFYFFWEIVLIPIYFLIGIWGAKNTRISANTTFFIYTILGSFLMLAGIIYIGFHLRPDSFLLEDVMKVTAEFGNLQTLAWLFLIAFAIKIPLFPLHSWQPAVYKTSPTPVTVVLSALMAKMGLFAVVNWYINMFPFSCEVYDNLLYVIGFGLIYASLIALTTNNVKKIIAFSSIAHLALIFMSLFSQSEIGIKGAYFQMFSHGIVVLGLWLSVDYMQRKYKIKTIKSIGGLAQIDPWIAIFFTFFGLANVALPLTSSFIGEFMMLNALYTYNPILCIIGCTGVILSAAYTLRLSTALLFGEPENIPEKRQKFPKTLWILFGLISIIILVLGVYPTVLFNLFQN
ncbi:complex I subunit 4 family protein [Moheibacter lacus]|uniref:NADH-quinone oxidoreductase subunit M n=1 Tax=Moheibacter lacus TaxID=2745851 RepID=A0A838ZHW3_9FLAO|nr:NADH-quinone oxidoreductase subunit M [Moheibacter lacus]MBA5629261.1 NADH-quinone oxidoreductase subunit M [Moheibacter lacus]